MVPVRIESTSLDILSSSVEVDVGGALYAGQLAACIADGGPSDAGYCRVANVSLSDVPLQGVRGALPVRVQARDDLGNQSANDAGTLSVSRWAFSFDGGSLNNGFSVAPSGAVVIPDSIGSQIVTIDARGRLLATIGTTHPPVRNVAIGTNNAVETVHVLATSSSGVSYGVSYDLMTSAMKGVWAAEAMRRGVQRDGLALSATASKETLAFAYRVNNNIVADWAVFSGGGYAGAGTTALGPTVASVNLRAVANGNQLHATDRQSLFLFSASMPSFDQLSVNSASQGLPSPFTGITDLIGLGPGGAGLALDTNSSRVFSSVFPSGFTAWAGQSPDQFTRPVAKSGTVFFVRTTGLAASICRSQAGAGTFVCTAMPGQEQVTDIALGAGDTLYTVVTRLPSNASFLQVRTASTLALRDEISLPGVTGGCLTLTPTCVLGRPVIGCVDTAHIVFVFTDARGVDTTADWPMEGHDPAKTFNTATDLSQYACP